MTAALDDDTLTDDELDDDELSDEDLAAMAAAALRAVKQQRDRTHDAAAALLLPVLAKLAAGYDLAMLRVLHPDDPRGLRRMIVAADLARQTAALHADPDWEQATRDAHTAAVLAGTAAAAHVLTAGGAPVDPDESPFPNPFGPRGWIADQQGGLAGDLIDAFDAALAAGDELTDDAAAELLRAGAGALYYLDLELSQTYLSASAALYSSVGLDTIMWNTMADACRVCQNLEAGNPYASWDVPAVPHGMCRCWITPA